MKNVDEIKKALEGMVKFADMIDRSVLDAVDVQLLKNTLNLINQYETKIKSKQETIDSFTDIGKLYSEIKAETYKECIEKVKEKAKATEVVYSGAFVRTDYTISNKDFDNLLKEMGVE